MLEAERISRNQARLTEMYPVFRDKVIPILKELEEAGYRPRIQVAWRSVSDQLEAYRNGYSQVTYGYHNATSPQGNKEALAADILDDDNPLSAKTDYMLRLAAAAEKQGLTTGIRWGLTDEKAQLVNAALASQNWTMPVHVGWDPLHVEVTGISIADVKAGKRPAPDGSVVDDSGGSSSGGGETPEPVETLPKRKFRVEEVATTAIQEYELGGPLRPTSLLSVPYVSQLAPDAAAHNNDCGAACAVMLLRAYQKVSLSPDDFYVKFGISGDPYLSVTQMRNAMSSLGLVTDFKAGLGIQDIFNALAAGRPLIALFRYKTLVDAGLTEKTFQGPHFAVIVGIDIKYVYIHDPLYTDPLRGEAHPYPLDVFWRAWKEVAQDPSLPNPERSAIIPVSGIGFQVLRRVKVNIATLNVRSGPGLGYNIVSTVKRNDILEIQREMSGWGEIGLNRWVSLSYTVPA